ncbi:hypothetical protein SS50377_27763 [Spironucleus salmonicida]|uniref:Uncharacterized protein n=1 Tax=Spironucleus salmonicida TaxID=348837 RepID=V6LJZ5_9EUKA|nr:hypothetical protein SS50377_27763 [Spironucleus salmonicida]|eukprot:EST44867.1 Hypothetical protein SS50377_15227 [Spironucleus salmonicida]
MAARSIDKNAAVEILSRHLASFSMYSYVQLLGDHQLLADQITAYGADWKAVAEELGISKSKLYHWFRETFVRKLADRISPEDMLLIKKEVCIGTAKEEILELLSREYNCQVFNVAIQNARKLHQRKVTIKAAPSADYKNMAASMPQLRLDKMQHLANETIMASGRAPQQPPMDFIMEASSDFSIQLV